MDSFAKNRKACLLNCSHNTKPGKELFQPSGFAELFQETNNLSWLRHTVSLDACPLEQESKNRLYPHEKKKWLCFCTYSYWSGGDWNGVNEVFDFVALILEKVDVTVARFKLASHRTATKPRNTAVLATAGGYVNHVLSSHECFSNTCWTWGTVHAILCQVIGIGEMGESK